MGWTFVFTIKNDSLQCWFVRVTHGNLVTLMSALLSCWLPHLRSLTTTSHSLQPRTFTGRPGSNLLSLSTYERGWWFTLTFWRSLTTEWVALRNFTGANGMVGVILIFMDIDGAFSAFCSCVDGVFSWIIRFGLEPVIVNNLEASKLRQQIQIQTSNH